MTSGRQAGKSEGGSWVYCLFSWWSDSGCSSYVFASDKEMICERG